MSEGANPLPHVVGREDALPHTIKRKKPRVLFDAEAREIYLDALCSYGAVEMAAKIAGVTTRQLRAVHADPFGQCSHLILHRLGRLEDVTCLTYWPCS